MIILGSLYVCTHIDHADVYKSRQFKLNFHSYSRLVFGFTRISQVYFELMTLMAKKIFQRTTKLRWSESEIEVTVQFSLLFITNQI